MSTERPKGTHELAFRWSVPKTRAAVLLAEDTLTDEQIATEVGVSRSAVKRWKEHAEFRAQIGDHVGQLQAAMLRLAIARKRDRVRTLDDLHQRLLTVVEERAEDMAGEVAGGGTGLLVRQVKQIGTGRDATTIREYVVDTGLVREIRGLEEQAAKELGQWVEKSQTEDLTRVVELIGIDANAI